MILTRRSLFAGVSAAALIPAGLHAAAVPNAVRRVEPVPARFVRLAPSRLHRSAGCSNIAH